MAEKEIEIWKDIPGYEGLYQASTKGKIKSLPLIYYSGKDHRSIRIRPEKIMQCRITKEGYPSVMLSNSGVRKYYLVHRLVALTFISNPEGLPEINHMDGDKGNPYYKNLEWCDRKYNIQHAVRTGLKVAPSGIKSPTAKKIIQFDINGNFIQEWGCIADAVNKLKIGHQSITHALKGRWKQAYGYKWSYA